MKIVRIYDIKDIKKRVRDEEELASRGFFPVEEEEVTKYSAGKGLALGLVFLPLAVLGTKKKIKITYERKDA
jgi:hypothetical protein